MTIRKHLNLGLLILAVMMLAACGAKIVRGAAPIVRMNDLSHDGETITLLLSMRNLNGVELSVQQIDFSLSVKNETLFTYNGPVDTSIVANGTETWNVDVEESEISEKLLDSLQQGEVKSLPYSLEGTIISVEDGKLHFEHDGHIYPVPGRPGHFR
jgi:outer membrane lipoprotein-sorting protein